MAQAVEEADALGYPVVVKAQVQVGGRGKAGGIKLAADAAEVRTHAEAILGMDIKGHIVEVVWIEKASDIAEEYYALVHARPCRQAPPRACSRRRAAWRSSRSPRRIPTPSRASTWIPSTGSARRSAVNGSRRRNLNPAANDGAVEVLLNLYRAYTEGDADLVEINPLILTPDGRVHALDAKVTLDDNAVFRHPDYVEYDATQVRDTRERFAHERGLQYVGLDGSVGVIANGAGLAMSTVDIVNQVGGSPANFLDIGGGANADVMAGALEVITSDANVRSIFINIFGGITKGEEVANGIVQALDRVKIDPPIVIRLDGTNADEGRAILEPHLSDKLRMELTMVDAARLVVELAK